MADLLDRGLQWLHGKRQKHMARAVTYRRTEAGQVTTIPIEATIGRTEFQQTNEFGLVRTIESRDYLFPAADLKVGGAQVMPKAGDRILEFADGKCYAHEVMSPSDEPPWRWSDAYKRTIRVHTKFIGTE